jgi:hypothetical protein
VRSCSRTPRLGQKWPNTNRSLGSKRSDKMNGRDVPKRCRLLPECTAKLPTQPPNQRKWGNNIRSNSAEISSRGRKQCCYCLDRRDQGVTQRCSFGCQVDPEGQLGAVTQRWSRGCKVDPAGQVGSATQRWSLGCKVYPAAHSSATSVASGTVSCEL